MLDFCKLQACGVIRGTFIYADTGYNICLDGENISVIYDIFPFLFLKQIVWNKSSLALYLQVPIWHLSVQVGFSCKNKKPFYLK